MLKNTIGLLFLDILLVLLVFFILCILLVFIRGLFIFFIRLSIDTLLSRLGFILLLWLFFFYNK